MSDNLFDLHPPFQIDGNFGYTAGVSEMLMQSHEENTIRLLPALPRQWENGYVKGLKARGGLTIDMFWSDNVLEKAIISSKINKKINLHYLDEVVHVEMQKGDTYIYEPSGKNK